MGTNFRVIFVLGGLVGEVLPSESPDYYDNILIEKVPKTKSIDKFNYLVTSMGSS